MVREVEELEPEPHLDRNRETANRRAKVTEKDADPHAIPDHLGPRERELWQVALVKMIKARAAIAGFDEEKYRRALDARTEAVEAGVEAGISDNQIAEFLGITRQRVGQIRRKHANRLRERNRGDRGRGSQTIDVDEIPS